MTIRDQICHTALSLVGTPWHHRAMVPAVGIDCVRTLEYVAKAVGLLASAWQPPLYSPDWHMHQNVEELLRVLEMLGCTPVALDARQPGDLLAFQFGRVTSHVGVLVACTPDYLVHAARDYGKVVHQRLSGQLLGRLRQAYCFPGVTS